MADTVLVAVPNTAVTVPLPMTQGASGYAYNQASVTYEQAPLAYEGSVPGFSITVIVDEEN